MCPHAQNAAPDVSGRMVYAIQVSAQYSVGCAATAATASQNLAWRNLEK